MNPPPFPSDQYPDRSIFPSL